MSGRGLSTSKRPPNSNNGFSSHQVHIQQILAVTAALVSVFSAAISLYWLIRMKKNFRHKLILLLILTNMLKALVYLIYPIVIFVGGPINDKSRFCQLSGFISVVGIEASDFVILLIAIHTILYMIRPNRSTIGSGLYPFRYTAYICGAVFSILMASIAFVNPKGGYVTQGTFCYIPSRPFWYRLALAWIPRYLILGSILAIYIVIFTFVRTRLNRFESDSAMSYELPSSGSPITSRNDIAFRRGSRTHQLPLPPLRSLNLATSNAKMLADTYITHRQSITIAEPRAARQPSQASNGPSDRPEPVWERYSFGHLTPIPNVLPEDELEPTRPTDTQYPRRNPTIIETLQQQIASSIKPFQPTVDTAPPVPQAQPDAWYQLNSPDTNPSATSQMKATNGDDMRDIANVTLRRRHKTIKRQMRFLLVYPLVYWLTWIIPFVNHCFQYNDHYAANPSFPLTCTSTTILALQCAIDCWLFGYKEKPWRQIGSGSMTFWQSFQFWKHRSHLEAATLPTVERKNGVGTMPRNWWSQEDILRGTSSGRASEDPVNESGAGSLSAGPRRGVEA